MGCGKGGWGERCWSRTLVGCRRVHAVNFPEVWISKVGTVTAICKILQGLRRENIWDHTVWEVRFYRFVVRLSVPRTLGDTLRGYGQVVLLSVATTCTYNGGD